MPSGPNGSLKFEFSLKLPVPFDSIHPREMSKNKLTIFICQLSGYQPCSVLYSVSSVGELLINIISARCRTSQFVRSS